MNYCGIILAKRKSERLERKNFLTIGNKEIWEYPFDAMVDSNRIDYIKLFTDRKTMNNRPPGAALPNEPLFEAIQWAYKNLPRRYDAIVSIMANCPMITSKDVIRAIDRFEALGCDELRGFNEHGKESGLIIMKEKYLLEKYQISTYQAAIEIRSDEIHTQDDLDRCKLIINNR